VLEVSPGGRVKSYLGGFTQYAEMRQREGRPLPGYAKAGAAVAPEELARARSEAAGGGDDRKQGEQFRERRREEKARVAEEKKLTARIEAADAEKARLAAEFEDPALYGDGKLLAAKRARHAELDAELAKLWRRLEELA
jgi:hypothetical protein